MFRFQQFARRRGYSTSPTNPPPRFSRLRPYIDALSKLSARTNTPLPSLVLSFAILHEITAILPFAGFFFAARGLGMGEAVVAMIKEPSSADVRPQANSPHPISEMKEEAGWMLLKAREYMDEGEAWASRVGRRYGLWGFEKGSAASTSLDKEKAELVKKRLAGDVANAVVAYGLTKAIFPLRVGLAVYLSPAFSRSLLDPTRRALLKVVSKFRN